ncbi:MAG: tRNA (guanosine(18)-2'-O)-methyltransferase TrmH [Gammaproteobacteria bacterium]|nr:tRNA (guanosine(18)-2'-O)-methyltransferase TrmH [Gammaproteobacteria bacterium]
MTPARLAKYKATLACRQLDLTIITDQVNKAQNIAALIRTCDAVGVHNAHVVTPEEGFREHKRTARGSQQWVNVIEHDSIMPALAAVKQQGMQVVCAHFSDQAVDFRELDYTQPTALVLGAEMHGVSPQAIAGADHQVVIPMLGMVHSFNVSVAAAVILLEAQRQRQLKGGYSYPQLIGMEYHQTLFRWCHPKIADFCHRHGFNYPAMGEDGGIVNLNQWYANACTSCGLTETSIGRADKWL